MMRGPARRVALVAVACVTVLAGALAQAHHVDDPRYCGAPVRNASGEIIRSSWRTMQFKHLYPCPVTGESDGACPGWSVDHVIPLVCGGCDDIGNLQWLPNKIKSAAGTLPKDRWERRVYCVAGD